MLLVFLTVTHAALPSYKWERYWQTSTDVAYEMFMDDCAKVSCAVIFCDATLTTLVLIGRTLAMRIGKEQS